MAALEFIEKFDVPAHVHAIGGEMLQALRRIQGSAKYIGEVRGIGMMFGVEFVRDVVTKEPFAELAQAVKKLCYERGLIVELGGYYGNVVRFLPPLVITKTIAENGLRIFEKAVQEAEAAV